MNIMKKLTTTIVVIIIVIVIGVYFLSRPYGNKDVVTNQVPVTDTTASQDTQTDQTQNIAPVNKDETIIGTSVSGNSIMAYHFGEGATELLFIGGIHGGYEWNTVLVAKELMNYLKDNPSAIPANVKVTVIPVLNPDGLNKVVGTTTGNFTQSDVPLTSSSNIIVSGRFNGNNVDLNRNFDCDWQANGMWQNKEVSGGTSAFSEPESQAIKNYTETNKPSAVVVWYSAAGGVYASSCHNGVSAETNTITKKFADVSGYPAYQSFDFYAITGDMVNWFAKENIPAISVLLTNHMDVEWTKNLAGIQALLKYYTK